MYLTPIECFSTAKKAIKIHLLFEKDQTEWLKQQNARVQQWAKLNHLAEKKLLLLPSEEGKLAEVVFVVKDESQWLQIGALPFQLPEGRYYFTPLSFELLAHAYLAWGMGAYQYTQYKKPTRAPAQLVWPAKLDQKEIIHTLEAIYLVRDLINTPADQMMPQDLSAYAAQTAKKFKAKYKEIVGKNLLKENFPCIYHVGRASAHEPRLLELRWGNTKHPKITLVGKGVCFDTGGLNIKDDKGMLLMKKDMGGAAHVLGLAQLMMSQNLPIQLHVLIPTVENAVSGEAYHPGDILTSRTGKTIEITNTDAEGRLILCDALAAAAEEKPQMIIDFATLTGAAKIALGAEVAAFFTNDEALAQQVAESSQRVNDPCWRLPLYQPYRKLLDSNIADMANCSLGSYAGAITAALYLQEFVPPKQSWIHFDIMASNVKTAPGRPEGGEANGLRAMYEILKGKV